VISEPPTRLIDSDASRLDRPGSGERNLGKHVRRRRHGPSHRPRGFVFGDRPIEQEYAKPDAKHGQDRCDDQDRNHARPVTPATLHNRSNGGIPGMFPKPPLTRRAIPGY